MLHAIHSLQFRIHTPVLMTLLVASLSTLTIWARPVSTSLSPQTTATVVQQISAADQGALRECDRQANAAGNPAAPTKASSALETQLAAPIHFLPFLSPFLFFLP